MEPSAAPPSPPLTGRIVKIIIITILILALPAVLLGALSTQSTKQEAAVDTEQRPNILIIVTEATTPYMLSAMPTVADRLGRTGVTFRNAYVSLPENGLDRLSAWAERAGYTTLTLGGGEESFSQEKASTFLQTSASPFLLMMRSDATSSPRTCDSSSIERMPAFNEADVSDKSEWVRKLPLLAGQNQSRLASQAATQFCSLQTLDNSIGLMLDGLGRKRDNTIIVITAERGYSLGDHRYVGNTCLYDACTKVPLVVSYPPITTGPQVSDALVQSSDIVATIADLSGLAPDELTNGRSFAALLINPKGAHRSEIVLSLPGNEREPAGESLRARDFKYITLATGEEELYDLTADPFEMTSVAAIAEYAPVRDRLRDQLRSQRSE